MDSRLFGFIVAGFGKVSRKPHMPQFIGVGGENHPVFARQQIPPEMLKNELWIGVP
ncbi:hypothetical protein GCM10025858_24940 [Alicyclobacillus sacchari]|nr:hypothetical protein GCM10025858_24940 [Alicyclobacillus sacchari]